MKRRVQCSPTYVVVDMTAEAAAAAAAAEVVVDQGMDSSRRLV
jgi:hypothetical protein